MRFPKPLRVLTTVAIVAALGAAAFFTRDHWMPFFSQEAVHAEAQEKAAPVDEPKVLKLSPQARKNLGLAAKPAKAQTYWRKIQVPGAIVDRPGYSDRGVTSPAVGVVTQVHAFPGDTVNVGDRLFTLRLFSEYLQNTQKEFFSSTREIQFIESELERIRPLAEQGVVAKSRIIEFENQLRRQAAVIQAHRQDLLTRGLNPSQIESVAEGKFVATVEIVAPPLVEKRGESLPTRPVALRLADNQEDKFAYEVQELTAELGQQVQAG